MKQDQNKERVFNFIDTSYRQFGVSPSVRDICEALKITPHAVHRWQIILAKEGKLTKINNWFSKHYIPSGYKVVTEEFFKSYQKLACQHLKEGEPHESTQSLLDRPQV